VPQPQCVEKREFPGPQRENGRICIAKYSAPLKRIASRTELSRNFARGSIDNAFFGTLNGYHWLIYAPLHTMRHDKQIAEVKGTAGYPQ
jgi:hypothetical protein